MVCQMCLHHVECLQTEVDHPLRQEAQVVAAEVKLQLGVRFAATIVTDLVICRATARNQTNVVSLLVDTVEISPDRRKAVNHVDVSAANKRVIS